MKPMVVILVAIVLATPVLVGAQYWGQDNGYTIIKLGEPPTFVNPNFNGGYTAITPGEPPTFINRSFNGGYTAITPGEPPTFINRSFNGGYTVITPGEPPTFVNPTIPLAPSTSRFFGEDDAGDD